MKESESDEMNRAHAKHAERIRPELSFYHANAKGTGSAMKLSLHPARGNKDGCIMLTMARQRTTGNGQIPYATFSWESRLTVKLDFQDLSKIVQVFRGECESIEEGRGLYHTTAGFSTRIVLRHIVEPFSCWSLELYRSAKGRKADDASARIVLSPNEALGLCLAIENSFGLLCFGAPVPDEGDMSISANTSGGMRHAVA